METNQNLPLPIDAVLPAVLEALARASSVVLRAPAGAGKTTRVPPAVLDAGFGKAGQVIVLQPRRVAARAAARRMAAERGDQLGESVGYHVRFEREVGPQTRIIVMTEGVLLRKLHDDPFLEHVGLVVFDEFHERNVYSDLALGMVRRLQQTVRPDLKIVVMSATLAAEPIAAYLDECPTVECEGRTFPVDIAYWRGAGRRNLAELTLEGIQHVLQQESGDMLVFLPGVGEIRRVAEGLRRAANRPELAILPLYGDLSSEAQDAVLRPASRRKVVLATNVAETSLTIDGITTVVDSGLARKLRFDPRVGLDRLELLPISQAAADQRAGRAGRTQPGSCLRMWDQATHRNRPAFEEPEIRCIDLAGPVLQLHSWGEPDVLSFPWFEPPRLESVERATLLLRRLGAIDDSGITAIGRRLARFPVHPRIARLLVEGAARGCLPAAALAAALLSERDPFDREVRPGMSRGRGMPTRLDYHTQSDVVDRVRAIEEYERSRTLAAHCGQLKPGAAAHVLRVRDQLLREGGATLGEHEASAPKRDARPVEAANSPSPTGAGERPHRDAFDGGEEPLMRALLAALPDRLAIRRERNGEKGLMVGGCGVCLHPQSAVRQSELFLCVDVEAGRSDAIVRLASAVERDWLPASGLRTLDELFFHPSQKRVAARRRTYWDDLLLAETPTAVVDHEQAAAVLAKAAAVDWDRVFPHDNAELNGFLNRVRCLAEWRPDLDLPEFGEPELHSVLHGLCHSHRSFDELRKAPWLAAVRGRLDAQQLAILDREAPERLQLPRGTRVKLDYQLGKPPVLAVKIQDAFGLAETPRVASGRVPVVLHLLGPNMRPQQVTNDLASFWTNTYPQVRKELARRYPKHAWPENPREA